MKDIKIILSSIIGVISALPSYANNANDINAYIRGLQYDSQLQLNVTESDTTPSRQRDATACQRMPRQLNQKLQTIALSPTTKTAFPGMLIPVNRRLAEGRPDTISLPRGPMTLHIDLPGLNELGKKAIANPSASSVQSAIDEVIAVWNTRPNSEQYVNAARST